MDSDAASDTTMQTAPSRLPPPPRSSQPQTQAAHSTALEPPKPSPNATRASSPVPMEVDEPAVEESVASAPSFDLLDRIPGMYRLLDLVQERGSGSGGMVDKIIIAQASIQAFANKVHPGSYRSDIQVDFKTLDQHVIKPRGIYGSASTIVDFLDKLDCMDDEVRSLMLRRRDESSGVTCPTLRPGLYLLSPLSDNTGMVYIIFWPEDGTWQDGVISSVSRNRVTFMRFCPTGLEG
ncbi:hypothetical protein M408DRAFT_172603 [Serendipita vermifera MAFF 305830]|uniref:Uncharacterized protein n=1 Tax=Serendipita vermifera MAFF 305830 TaxID=933852 RepID=A0A0C3A5A1_SERVB|nr:hypothetical protein M408DRAFT_172603 [Serendipita vermifera MAFF 305830]